MPFIVADVHDSNVSRYVQIALTTLHEICRTYEIKEVSDVDARLCLMFPHEQGCDKIFAYQETRWKHLCIGIVFDILTSLGWPDNKVSNREVLREFRSRSHIDTLDMPNTSLIEDIIVALRHYSDISPDEALVQVRENFNCG